MRTARGCGIINEWLSYAYLVIPRLRDYMPKFVRSVLFQWKNTPILTLPYPNLHIIFRPLTPQLALLASINGLIGIETYLHRILQYLRRLPYSRGFRNDLRHLLLRFAMTEFQELICMVLYASSFACLLDPTLLLAKV